VQADHHTEVDAVVNDQTRTMQTDKATLDTIIGPYRLVAQLGEGGMGVVYRAQQLKPLRREVALKIIKPGMDSKQVIARFESERQALAVTDHSNIARVFDAGTTPSGLPYFVMELVEGIPITDYCDSKRLTIPQRIELFVPVCQAIQHAHQKGIIHRDIKPSNILIRQQENQAVPKVIDFGLAKALTYEASEATMMTGAGSIVGTLSYMSPEQAEWGRHDIDTRTDVYSLGAVLYELLTGSTPLDHLEGSSYIEVLQRIREEEPKTPSARVLRSGELKQIASLRQSDPARLPKLLDRELNWITRKALEKDRSRRYETANGLARDLQRYLEGEPIEAAPPSAAYRIGKILRKYRAWLATAAAFAALLVAGIIFSALMAVRASRARAEAQAVNAFLEKDLLAQASAYNQSAGAKPDPNMTVRTALDRAAARIEGKFATQPLVEASIRQSMGAAYVDLGLYPQAEQQFGRALAIRRRTLGEKDPDTLASMGSLAAVYERRGNLKAAEPLYLETVALERRALGNQHPATLKTMNGLAATYMDEDEFAKAAPILEQVVPLDQRVFGERDLQTLRAMGNLAATYALLNKYDQAELLFVRTLELKRRALGEENPETLDTMSNLAQVYFLRGEYKDADALCTRALAAYRRILGDSHPSTINAMNSLADLESARGDYRQAEEQYQEAIEGAARGGESEHPHALQTLSGLADLYEREGNVSQSAGLYKKVLDTRRRVLGIDHPDTLENSVDLARIYFKQQKYAEAESLLREALPIYETTAPDAWQHFEAEAFLGACLAGQKRYADAEPILLSGYAGLTKQENTIAASDRHIVREAGASIVKLYRDWGKPQNAAEWQTKLAK